MTTAISLRIGLNRIDPAHYCTEGGVLAGCINEARAMRGTAESRGFQGTLLVG